MQLFHSYVPDVDLLHLKDLIDVTLAIEEVMKVIKRWKLSSEESYQVRKVIYWSKLCSEESYIVMKVILWWKLKKLKLPKKWKGAMAGDVSPVAMFIFVEWQKAGSFSLLTSCASYDT